MSACTIKNVYFTELPVHHIGAVAEFTSWQKRVYLSEKEVDDVSQAFSDPADS